MKISVIADQLVVDKQLIDNTVSEVVEFDTLDDFAVLATNFHIACGVFKDNVKTLANLLEIQFLHFDFDDGVVDSKEVHDSLKHNTNHIILGSKNYLKDKMDGKGSIERFHLFVPLDKPVTDPTLYKEICRKFASLNRWSVDNNCIEASRYFAKHPICLYVYAKSANLSVDRFTKIVELERKSKERASEFFEETNMNTDPVEQFKKTKYYRMLVNGDLMTDGERYIKSCQIIGCMMKIGLNMQECMSIFDQFSRWGSSFTRDSIIRRIKDWAK